MAYPEAFTLLHHALATHASQPARPMEPCIIKKGLEGDAIAYRSRTLGADGTHANEWGARPGVSYAVAAAAHRSWGDPRVPQPFRFP